MTGNYSGAMHLMAKRWKNEASLDPRKYDLSNSSLNARTKLEDATPSQKPW